MKISETCNELIARGSQFHPMFGNRLANHLSMALIALDRMGANSGRLQEFYTHYISRLKQLVSESIETEFADPVKHLGSRDRFNNFFQYFKSEIKNKGAEEVLRNWVPLLLPGFSASAFHAFIRLAYSIETGIESEMSISLAYLASEYQDLGQIGPFTTETIEMVASRLSEITHTHQFAPGIIVDQMTEIVGMHLFQSAAIQPEKINLNDIANFTVCAYAQENDFTLLHTVTACHAFRIVSPYINDKILALRYLWQGVLVAYLSTGLVFTPIKDFKNNSSMEWSECLEKAVSSNNDHIIKLTYTAWQEAKIYESPLYLFIAQRQNGDSPTI